MSDLATFDLYVRAEDPEEASASGREWADAEPRIRFEGIVSVEPMIPGIPGTAWRVSVAAYVIHDAAPTLWDLS